MKTSAPGRPRKPPPSPELIVFFDGVCNLCNAAVSFILDRDARGRIRFASLQSSFAARTLPSFGRDPADMTSMLVLKDGKLLSESDAVAAIAAELSGIWRWGRHIRILPRPFRDALYTCTARNRYRLFGKREACRIPKKGEVERFLT